MNCKGMNCYSMKFEPVKYFASDGRPEPITDSIIAEDNEAVIQIIKKVRSTVLRHLPRAHRIDVPWRFDVSSRSQVS